MMIHKFNIAGPGSPVVELRAHLWSSRYELFLNGKSLGKIKVRASHKDFNDENGATHFITIYPSGLFPFAPPLVSIDGIIVSKGEPVKLYENIFQTLLFLVVILLLSNESRVRGLENYLIVGTIYFVAIAIFYYGQYYYFSKARAKLGVPGRIAYFAANAVALFILVKGITALIGID